MRGYANMKQGVASPGELAGTCRAPAGQAMFFRCPIDATVPSTACRKKMCIRDSPEGEGSLNTNIPIQNVPY